jgi:hypothetical protein
MLGVGMNSVFSDSTLRRYPISPAERFVARHMSACLEPLWILVFALYLGSAVGFSMLGLASPWAALPAAFLLVISNYLFARILLILVARVLAMRNGPLILIAAIALLTALPALALPIISRYSGHSVSISAAPRFIPPFAAAACMTGLASLPLLGWMLYLLAGCCLLAVVLFRLDRLPPPSQTVAEAEASWGSLYDRMAGFFGGVTAPLIGKILRYYARSPQTRFNYPCAPLLIVIAVMNTQSSFLSALSSISIIGSICLGGMAVNAFGFDGGGFRRYFLLPIRPAAVLRATAIVPLILGAATIPVSLAIWLVFAPIHIEAQMVVMLVCCGFGGLFLFQALGIWTSLFSPCAMPFNTAFGNKLSLSAKAVLFLCIAVWFGLPMVLGRLGTQTVLDCWWVAPLVLTITAGFYFMTLRLGAVIFSRRREIMLSTIEKGC